MSNKSNWFHVIEVKAFGENTEANPYFATLSCWLVGLAGAWAATSSVFDNVFGTELKTTFLTFVPIVVMMMVLNVCESLLSCKTWIASILRSLMVVLALGLMYGVGYVAAIVVYALVVLWLAFTILFEVIFRGKKKVDDDISTNRNEKICTEE